MKVFYFIVSLFVSFNSFSQGGFTKQLKAIISDTASGFSQFRGEAKLKGELTTGKNYMQYISTITLEGTRENNIKYLGGSLVSVYGYDALIADSVSESEGQRICNEWKDKIASILVNRFVIRKNEIKALNPGKYGWNLSKGELEISLDLFPIGSTNLNRVSMSIDYSIYNVK